MKLRTLAFAYLSLAITLPARAGKPVPDSPWVGIWQAQLEGQPSVILTLGDDTGQLGGGIVFNVIARDGGQAHIIGRDAHVLINPRVEGDTLRFQVIRLSDKRQLDMSMQMTADGTAQFHCANCGADSPVVDIVRER
jgi:hypothetical protein